MEILLSVSDTGKKPIYTRFILILIFLLNFITGFAQKAPSADIVFFNGKVWLGGDPPAFAEGIAIKGERIIQTGNDNEIKQWIGPMTQVIDLNERLLIPGFNDAHIHFLSGSLVRASIDLLSTHNSEEMKKAILVYADSHPEKKWLTGAGWQYDFFPGGMPSKEFLDSLVADRPVYLRSYDGHSGLANSMALSIAGIDQNTSYSGFGEIIKDAEGNPTGAFTEGATSLISSLIPQPGIDEKLNALREGMKYAASLGITSIQNASGSLEELELYNTLLKNKELTLRSSTAFSIGNSTADETIEKWIAAKNKMVDPLWLKASAIKFMLDGVIESHTAVMKAPYSDISANDPQQKIEFAIPLENYREKVAWLDREGFQLYTHAIGDSAVSEALGAYEHAIKTNRPRLRRHRIEHIEQIDPKDLKRFRTLGILPSMQPIHADPGTVEVWGRAVGTGRLPRSFNWASFIKEGNTLVFGSDWPACINADPLHGLHVAVNRKTTDGKPVEGWIPDQRLTINQALTAYTLNGAFASFEDDWKGLIRVGMLADLVVLSQDLFQIDPLQIHATKVDMTLVNGRIVFERKDEQAQKHP